MSVLIGSVEFDGPFTNSQEIRELPGIYGLLRRTGEEYELVDFGESSCLRHCLRPSQVNSGESFHAGPGELSIVVHYLLGKNTRERIDIKNRLMSELDDLPLETAC